MRIIKEPFAVKIDGKCQTNTDILQLFNFGFSRENVIKRYKKDNKITTEEAMKVVEQVLLENILKRRK